jgi:predicted DNA-binding protein
MPNQRGKDQVLISLQLSTELRDALLEGLEKTGKSQSQFIRDAITNDLGRLGYSLKETAARPPTRVGALKSGKYPKLKKG